MSTNQQTRDEGDGLMGAAIVVFGIAALICVVMFISGCSARAEDDMQLEPPQFSHGQYGYLKCVERAKKATAPIKESEKACKRAYLKG